jgi:hypothetical protein
MSKTGFRPYARAVAEYIHDGYGIDPTLQEGAKHPYLEFDYKGERRRVTLHHNTRGRSNALAMKLQDVRRELGPPPLTTEKRRETMEQPTSTASEPFNPLPLPEVITDQIERADLAPATETFSGRVAHYKAGLRLLVPIALARRFNPHNHAMTLRELQPAGTTWEVAISPEREAPRFGSGHGAVGHLTVQFNGVPGELFGMIPAEVLLSPDGKHLLFAINPADSKPVGEPLSHRKGKAAAAPKLVGARQPRKPVPRTEAASTPSVTAPTLVEAPQPPTHWAIPKLVEAATPDRAAMLSALHTIREVERGGTWHLAKVNGKWQFRVEPIVLEDE